MKSNKINLTILFSLLVVLFTTTITAQENSNNFTAPHSLLTMYNSKNYLGVNHKLNNAINQKPGDEYHTNAIDKEFLKLESAYRSGDKDIKNKIFEYKRNNNDSQYTQKVELMLGNTYVGEGEFEEAEKCYSNIDIKKLSLEDKEEYIVNRSLLLFNKQEYSKAEEELSQIVSKKSSYRIPAIFYLACANYAQADYAQAEEGFLECQNDKTFGTSANYYLANIYYVNKNYASALKIGEEVLNSSDCPKAYINPLKKICGECAFNSGDNNKTIVYLKEYTQYNNDNSSIYLLGVAYYNAKQYSDAIKTLRTLTNEKNNFSQSAYLYLGHSYLLTNDKNGAMFAYEKAMSDNTDAQVKECAMYNYCLIIEENNILTFDKKVEVYEKYINLFPKNSNAETINQLLATSYYTTKNYTAALASVNKVKSPSKELLKAKQVILYNLGVQEFEKKEYSKAKKYFDQSINVGDYSTNIKAKAYLWRGEINYLNKNYSQATSDFKKHISLLKQPDVNSFYSLGYALFMQKKYSEAEKQFTKHIAKNNSNKQIKADAYNRKGDCLYMMRNYSSALKAFSEAEKTYNLSADYSLYMQGIIYGVNKQHSNKINILSNLVMLYPQSSYAPKALLEKGNAQIALTQNDNALASFAKIYESYPKSPEARQALLQSALIYMNIGDENRAVSAYKTLIEEYSGSNEAKVAQEDLKNYHIQQGNIEPYAEYIKNTMGEEVYSNAQLDTLTYYAAESAFLKNPNDKSVTQLKTYINKYPNGIFTSNASYYIGQYGFNNNNFNEARTYFEKVIKSNNVVLLEETLHSLATIEELDSNYDKAYQYYSKLAKEYTTTQLGKEAQTSVVRVLSLDGKNNEVITYANKILSDNIDIPNIDEVRYYRAKAYKAIGDNENAKNDWEILSTTSHSTYSSEAKYMIAEMLYNQSQYTQAEESINSILSSGGVDRYWVARSIILLSDISAKQGDNFKAKQYLNSLKSNYTEDDDIQQMIKTRLTKYEK
jgi:TolA-binding protein